jgi:peptide/nickel transport system ATP-binding protein
VNAPLLEVRGLTTTFPDSADPRRRIPVVDAVDFDVRRGEVLALVGESGCGKSVSALSLLRLVPRPGRIEPQSRVVFEGRELLGLPVPEMREVRGAAIAMIFQEPMTALNPVQTVGAQVMEAIRLHERVSRGEARRRVEQLFERVGIPDPRARVGSYPHELSGGLKQRVMIAMAVAMRPRLLIADEPTTALDVTVQAQILELLRELQRELDTAIVLITHDLGVVNELADRGAVMYAGRIAERGTRLDVLGSPRHPYTQGLLRSMPARAVRGLRLEEIPGVVPAPGEWPAGCRFAPRCPKAFAPCAEQVPTPTPISSDHSACCHALGAAEHAA